VDARSRHAIEAARNSVSPIGGGLWVLVYHPELRISTPYREWNFGPHSTRMPEFCAPALGNRARSPPSTPRAPLAFTANDCLDIGTCLGGPVSVDYYDRAPFAFNGTIDTVNVRYSS
jgi:hypothetical protein